MIISDKLDNEYKNIIENIKNEKNSLLKKKIIGSLVMDIDGRCISQISKKTGCCRKYIKDCYIFVKNGCIHEKKKETRGRKRKEVLFPKLVDDIKEIVSNYENTDSHFKTEDLYVDLTLNQIKLELINKYGYSEKDCPCENKISSILKDNGYKISKVKKDKVIHKVEKNEQIFENIKETKSSIKYTDDSVAVISIDDKVRKIIGLVSENGYSWIERHALDHDTIFNYFVIPFGILDLKTNETFVTCTTSNSTANFKVDCIEKYLIEKTKNNKIKRLIIFLDNGPENSGSRTLWLKRISECATKFNIVIELAYYPPYHSKYNPIERVWARIQLAWSGLIIDTLEKLKTTINRITWKNKNIKCDISTTEYQKGIKVDKIEMRKIENNHIIRENGIEKWSILITP